MKEKHFNSLRTEDWIAICLAIITTLLLITVSVLPTILLNGCASIQLQAPQFKTLSIPLNGAVLEFKVPIDTPDFLQFEKSAAIQMTLNTIAVAYYTPETPDCGGKGTESYLFLIDFYNNKPEVVIFTHFKWVADDYESPENINAHWIYKNGMPEPATEAEVKKYIETFGLRDSQSRRL